MFLFEYIMDQVLTFLYYIYYRHYYFTANINWLYFLRIIFNYSILFKSIFLILLK